MRWNIPLLPIAVTIEKRPMKGFRFRIRSLLILVAGVAGVLFAWQAGPRSSAYRVRAALHLQKQQYDEFLIDSSRKSAASKEDSAKSAATQAERLALAGDVPGAERLRRLAAESELQARLFREGVEHWTRKATYHQAMCRKYAFSSRYPWVPTLPDPPEP